MHVYPLGNISMTGLFLPGSSSNFLSQSVGIVYVLPLFVYSASPFLELAKQITRQAAPTRTLIWSESYWPGHSVPSHSLLAAEASIIIS